MPLNSGRCWPPQVSASTRSDCGRVLLCADRGPPIGDLEALSARPTNCSGTGGRARWTSGGHLETLQHAFRRKSGGGGNLRVAEWSHFVEPALGVARKCARRAVTWRSYDGVVRAVAGAEVGARERLPVGRARGGTRRCSAILVRDVGRAGAAARGTSGRARGRRRAATVMCCSRRRYRRSAARRGVVFSTNRDGQSFSRFAEVGARERLPAASKRRARRRRAPPRGAEVGARERLPVVRAHARSRGVEKVRRNLSRRRERRGPPYERAITPDGQGA